MKKFILIIVLVFCISFALLPADSFAISAVDSGKCGTNLTWTYYSDGTLVIRGTGGMTNYSSYNTPWSKCGPITKLRISDGVTSIGDFAFGSGCSEISSLELPNSITKIGSYAFNGWSSLERVDIPANVSSIGNNAFSKCDMLHYLHLPDGLKFIGSYAFSDCASLELVSIYTGIIEVGDRAFKGCTNLYSVYIGSGTIGSYAFDGCTSLYRVIIGDNVSRIGTYAFNNASNLELVELGSGVETIERGAFYGCKKVGSVNYSGSVSSYLDINFGGLYANPCSCGAYLFFSDGRIVNLIVPSGKTAINTEAFRGCLNLESVTLPEGVTSICESAFDGCSNLKSISLPSSLVSIENAAFYCCTSLQSLNIPDGVTTISSNAFAGCSSLESINLPSGISELPYGVLHYCSALKSLDIPSGVRSIKAWAFEGCTSLEFANIPASVTVMGNKIFNECESLTHIYYAGSESQWKRISIDNTNKELTTSKVHYNCSPHSRNNPFSDLSSSSVYLDAVLWAAENGITSGYSDGTFRPQGPCTRAQVVTFLWRSAGSPKPTSDNNPFSDVKAEGSMKPFYDAILWGVERGITSGYSDGTFRPNDTVTRAQFVTFLWRYEGQPESTGDISNFKDAASISKPYHKAVAWGTENGIIAGYGDGTFRPNATCTRWAVVLFMFRA